MNMFGAFDPKAEIQALRKQLQSLQDQLAWQHRDDEYRMDVLSMKRSWQTSEEGNLTITEPLHMELYIPPNTKHIERVTLRLKLKTYEMYSGLLGITPFGEKETSGAIWGAGIDDGGETASDGAHDHNGTVSPDGDHSHSLRTHTHTVSVPDHTHGVVWAIFKHGNPSDVQIAINGVDVTAELGGPFNEDQESLDITKYVQAIGWNDIMFSVGQDVNDPPRGRIRAAIFVELYLP